MSDNKNSAGSEATTAKGKTKAAPEINTINMLDAAGNPSGRLVEFTGKRKLVKSSFVSDKGIGIRLDFVNGQSREFYLPAALVEKFAAHGAEQKLGDEIAGVEDIDDCVMAMDDLIDRLYNGEWAAKREVNAMAGASILAKALVQSSGKTLDEVRSFLKDKTHAEKVALRNNPKIAPIVAGLEAAKAAKKKPGKPVDTDSLLDALSAGPVVDPVSTLSTATAETAEAAA